MFGPLDVVKCVLGLRNDGIIQETSDTPMTVSSDGMLDLPGQEANCGYLDSCLTRRRGNALAKCALDTFEDASRG